MTAFLSTHATQQELTAPVDPSQTLHKQLQITMQAFVLRRIIPKSRGAISTRVPNVFQFSTRKIHFVPEVATIPNSNSSYQHRCLSKLRQTESQDPDNEEDYVDEYMMDGKDFKTAEDMDFYDVLTDEYFPSNDVDELKEAEAEEARRQTIRDEIDSRKGRLWQDPWEITDDDWASGKSYEDLPDWSEELCSRISLERVKVFDGE